MKLKCLFGFHTWQGCKCSKCNIVHDEDHDWSKNCEQCDKCDKKRSGVHSWVGCQCSKCSMTRNEKHDWSIDSGKCRKCGKLLRVTTSKNSGRKCTCGNEYERFTINEDDKLDFFECSKCGNGTCFYKDEQTILSGPEMAEFFLRDNEIVLGYYGGDHNPSTIVENFGCISESVCNRDCRMILLDFSSATCSSVPRFDKIFDGTYEEFSSRNREKIKKGLSGKKMAIITSNNHEKLALFKELSDSIARRDDINIQLFVSAKQAYGWLIG